MFIPLWLLIIFGLLWLFSAHSHNDERLVDKFDDLEQRIEDLEDKSEKPEYEDYE